MSAELPPFISRREVARLLNVSTRTIARWALTGALKPVRLSNRALRYCQHDVQRLIADGQTSQKEAA